MSTNAKIKANIRLEELSRNSFESPDNEVRNVSSNTSLAILSISSNPCPMCSGAILQSRIKRVVYGAADPKGGCIESCMQMYEIKGFNHYPEVTNGILKEECSELLKKFFKRKREEKKQRNN